MPNPSYRIEEDENKIVMINILIYNTWLMQIFGNVKHELVTLLEVNFW